MAFNLPASINTSAKQIPAVDFGAQAKLPGVSIHFPNLTDVSDASATFLTSFSVSGFATTGAPVDGLFAAVAVERQNSINGAPIWMTGQHLRNPLEPGVRVWDATARHARNYTLSGGKTGLLAGDGNTFTAVPTQGVAPTVTTGFIQGDVKYDASLQVIYTMGASAWGAAVSVASNPLIQFIPLVGNVVDMSVPGNLLQMTAATTITISAAAAGRNTVFRVLGDTVDRVLTLPANVRLGSLQAVAASVTIPAGWSGNIGVLATATGYEFNGEPQSFVADVATYSATTTDKRLLKEVLALKPVDRLANFSNSVRMGRSTALLVVGDSKSVDNTGQKGWVRRLTDRMPALSIGGAVVANRPQINYYQFDFNVSPQNFKPVQVIQAGTDRYHIFATGVTYQNVARTTAPFGVAFTGDFGIKLSFLANTLTPAARATLVVQGGSGSRVYALTLETNGNFQFTLSADGVDANLLNFVLTPAQYAAATTPVVAGTRVDLYVQMTSATGAVRWYTAPPNTDSYTEITAAANTGAGALVLYGATATTAYHFLGAATAGANPTSLFAGNIYDIQILGVNGRIMSPVNVESWLPSSGTLLNDASMGGVGTIKIYNSSYTGAQGTTFINRPQMYPNLIDGVVLHVLSADNENTIDNTASLGLTTALNNVLANEQTLIPNAPLAFFMNNMNLAGSSNPYSNHTRHAACNRWAVKNGYPIADFAIGWSRLPDKGSSLMGSDQQHPTYQAPGTDGVEFYTNMAAQFFNLTP